MKRLTMLAAAAFVLVGSIGCHANHCNKCNSCGPSSGGLLGRLAHHGGQGGRCNVSTGCRACGLGWQHGGLDYSEGLATGNPLHTFPGRQSPVPRGTYGGPDSYGGPGLRAGGLHGGAGVHGGAAAGMGAAASGPPTAGVAYPYYTTRGPRDFLLDNPPSIGR